VVGQVRIRATGTSPSGVFVGIGPASAVQAYLGPIAHSALTPPSTTQPSTPPPTGGPPATLPEQEPFWVARASGTGPQEMTWTPAAGDWAVVVMNADGSRQVAVTCPSAPPRRACA
jgi:hypothetical protein